MEREVQRRFQERVRRELGLDDEQARALAQAVTAFQDERRSLLQREARLRQRLRSTGPLLSDDEAGEVLEEMAALQVEEARLLQREQARLLEVLTAPQAVRFYTLRAELGERVRRLRGGGGPGPGGGPAGPLSRGAAGTL
jgi:Spy/CpxP family protein refolding chaperone